MLIQKIQPTLMLEACVETYAQAIMAEENGASRIELCSHLEFEGLTPNLELVKKLKAELSIPIFAMVRPRAGNFIYTTKEIQLMKDSICLFRDLKLKGVVFGVLDEECKLNLQVIHQLAILANPLEVTVHKAIDSTINPLEELDKLKELKSIDYVLTSGGAKSALEGIDTLKSMIRIAKDHLNIICAGGITNTNLFHLHAHLQAKHYHGTRIVGSLPAKS